MELIHFDDPEKYQAYISEVLVRREAENNLVLGILANLIAGEYSEKQPYLLVVQESGQIRAAALSTPPWPVLVSYENPPPGERVLKAMLADMREILQDDFTGISGNKEFVTNLISHWEKETDQGALLKMAMRIYKLETVIAVKGVPGQMRVMGEKDQGLVEQWQAEFNRETGSEEPDPNRIRKRVGAYLTADPSQRGLMLWEVEDKPVSMAGYAGPTPNGIRVGAVYTPPELRKNGYASALTAGLSQYLLDQGRQFCFLFTDLLNPTSNHIYQEIGYRPVCDVDRYLFV